MEKTSVKAIFYHKFKVDFSAGGNDVKRCCIAILRHENYQKWSTYNGMADSGQYESAYDANNGNYGYASETIVSKGSFPSKEGIIQVIVNMADLTFTVKDFETDEEYMKVKNDKFDQGEWVLGIRLRIKGVKL